VKTQRHVCSTLHHSVTLQLQPHAPQSHVAHAGLLQVVSTFLRIPLASTLAFGGAGGIAFGFASKGIFENFFGGWVDY
jgi:Mechanosensitive ion channel